MLLVVVMVVSVVSQDAYARGGGGGRGGGGRYYWHGDRWYNNGWFWFNAGVTALALGAVAASLPPYYATVYSGGVPYYYYDGIYYRPCPTGYMVVPAPVAAPAVVAAPVENVNAVQAPSPAPQGEFFTVNVPNYRGGYSPVTLTRSGTGFIGPQGEYYPEFPKIKQLKEMYGK